MLGWCDRCWICSAVGGIKIGAMLRREGSYMAGGWSRRATSSPGIWASASPEVATPVTCTYSTCSAYVAILWYLVS